jgi:hypothetical protein
MCPDAHTETAQFSTCSPTTRLDERNPIPPHLGETAYLFPALITAAAAAQSQVADRARRPLETLSAVPPPPPAPKRSKGRGGKNRDQDKNKPDAPPRKKIKGPKADAQAQRAQAKINGDVRPKKKPKKPKNKEAKKAKMKAKKAGKS